jgi:hypothetical protein
MPKPMLRVQGKNQGKYQGLKVGQDQTAVPRASSSPEAAKAARKARVAREYKGAK